MKNGKMKKIRDEIDKLKEYSMSALENKSDDKLIKLVKEDYNNLIDLRNRLECEGEDIYEEDHITCNHILDYMELLYSILKIMQEQKMDYKQMAVINERKLKTENEELKARVEELEQQFAYECGCNAELVETQKKNERLDILLNNVCSYICELCSHDKDFFTKEHSKMFFGMTEKEHKKYIFGEE